jgi:hypothetical protein
VTKERFEELAEAYGGDIVRWPAALREEAALLVVSEPDFARRVLGRAAGLDAALDELPRPTATSQLFDRIVGSAPAARRRRLWLAPAGLAAALAGVAACGLVLGVQLGGRSAANAEASSQVLADLDVSAIAEAG